MVGNSLAQKLLAEPSSQYPDKGFRPSQKLGGCVQKWVPLHLERISGRGHPVFHSLIGAIGKVQVEVPEEESPAGLSGHELLGLLDVPKDSMSLVASSDPLSDYVFLLNWAEAL